MRFFVAVTPPPDLQTRVSEAFPGLVVEPHITVKAQGGLDRESRDVWLPKIATVARRTNPVEVTLGGPGMFGDSVLYLSVESAGLAALHAAIMQELEVSEAAARTYFEGDAWVPHLTLKQGARISPSEFDDTAKRLLRNPTFVCRSLVLFGEQDQGYGREKELPLGPSSHATHRRANLHQQ
jgi:2'-5' RNA ligase